jgi:uncharacterized membrane protein
MYVLWWILFMNRTVNLQKYKMFVMGDIHGHMKYLKRFIRE